MALCAALMPTTALADQGPEAADRVGEAVAVRVEGVEALPEYVFVVSNVGCESHDALNDYAVVPAAPARVERSVGEAQVEECARQRLYALPRARFTVVDGKIAVLDALAPGQRVSLLAPEDVLVADLGIPFYWVHSLNTMDSITAEYRVSLTAERELAVTLLRVEFMYQGGKTRYGAAPAEPTGTGSDDAADDGDEDDEYSDVPYAPSLMNSCRRHPKHHPRRRLQRSPQRPRWRRPSPRVRVLRSCRRVPWRPRPRPRSYVYTIGTRSRSAADVWSSR